MRRFERLQERCQTMIAPDRRFSLEKFSSRTENPHGFGYLAPYRASPHPAVS